MDHARHDSVQNDQVQYEVQIQPIVVDHLFMPENFTVLESIYTHCISFAGSPRSRFVTICLHVRPCCTAFAISR
jgi:hypothetical protein